MSKFISPHEFNAAMLRALKMEGKRVTKMQLTFEVNKMPTIELTRLLDADDADGLVTVIEVMQLRAVAPATEKP